VLADPELSQLAAGDGGLFRATASVSMAIALLLAVMADKVVRGKQLLPHLLIWPYAVAPAIAGMLWLFMFNPTIGTLAYLLRAMGIAWNPLLNGDQAMMLIVIAAAWKQISYNFLFFVAGLQAIPRSLIEAAAIDGAADEALLDHRLPAALADHLLPAGRQHGLRDLRHLRHHRCRDRRRPGQGHRDAGLQGLQRRLRRPQSSAPRRPVGHPDGDRDRAHRLPVPLVERKVHYG
jgi:hypothetical protein